VSSSVPELSSVPLVWSDVPVSVEPVSAGVLASGVLALLSSVDGVEPLSSGVSGGVASGGAGSAGPASGGAAAATTIVSGARTASARETLRPISTPVPSIASTSAAAVRGDGMGSIGSPAGGRRIGARSLRPRAERRVNGW
jgi:hypothetical protein